MNIEFFSFEGCPNRKQALDNLKEALRLEGLPDALSMITVDSEADAQQKHFLGSPTIRVDGIDLEGPEADQKGYGYGCRIYSEEGHKAGWPSVGQIRRALRSTPTQ